MRKNIGGFTGVDIVIAIGTIIILLPIVLLVFVNININIQRTKRNSDATQYATEILEESQRMYYDDVTVENLNTFVQELNIPEAYEIHILVKPYNENDNSLEDLVKTVEVTVSYEIGKEIEIVKLSRIKSKENLITPNKPILGTNYIPVVYKVDNIKGDYWQIVSYNDSTWYNYTNKNWAIVMEIEGIEIEGEIEVNSSNRESLVGKKVTVPTDVYVWIPRYGTENGKIEFLYKTTNKSVDKSGKLSQNDLITDFEEDSSGEYVKITDTENILYKTLNESKYGPRKQW